MTVPAYDIRSRLQAARLPSMPQILLKLLEQCQTNDVGFEILAELISKDPGIATKILTVANSSAYHRNHKMVGLKNSLLLIGTNVVKTIIISETVFQLFNHFSQPNCIELRRFWKHSLHAAVIARDIAVRMAYPHLEEAYLAGLLHDIGRLALKAAAPQEYASSFAAADDANLCAIEQRTLQITHAQAGAWLIEKWELESFLADSVLYHHESAARLRNTHPVIRIVFLAHLLSHPEADDAALFDAAGLCGLDPADLLEIREHALVQVKETANQLGIDLSDVDEITAPLAAQLPPPPDHARERLSEEVGNLLLSSNAAASFSQAHSEESLHDNVLRSSRILFSFDDAILLRLSANPHGFNGSVFGRDRQHLNHVSISAKAINVISVAALEKRPTYLERGTRLMDIGEEQLLRILGTDALVVLPIVIDNQSTALLIGGIAAHRLADVQRRERFLQAFSSQVGTALKLVGVERKNNDQLVTTLALQYRDASRQMAHEVNNPLSIIKNYLSILDRKMQRNEPVSGEMAILNEEIDRVGKIVTDLADLQLSSDVKEQMNTDVNQVADGVIALLKKTEFIPPSVHVITRLVNQPGKVAASVDQVKQILLNLLMNAVEAMQAGGEIEVSNNGSVNRDGHLFLEISIRDTGPGIDAAALAKLFTLGYSSKTGEQRGQGLSIVQSLIRQIDGAIMCRSSPRGTTFDILLPLPKVAAMSGLGQDDIDLSPAAGKAAAAPSQMDTP